MIPPKLVKEIERWMDNCLYGHLQINFAGGKIVNINRVESIKIDLLIVNSPDTRVSAISSQSIEV